ncbi:MAG TPA: ABC transporter permease [Opitutaceae bacterium]|jgi:lipopolysaccharide transport system permease protein|nr:ABC transporter permease [Opitutaceae bacterium]
MNSSATPAIRETVIQPTRGLRLAPWGELYTYRDLLWVMVWRDIAARYKQTILGPLWFLLQPLLNTIVFTLIFGRVAHLSTSGLPGPLFYLCGQLLWGYFAATFNSTAMTLAINHQLFGKVYFPRLIVPLSGVISNLVALGIQLSLFVLFYLGYKLGPAAPTFGVTPWIVLLPLVIVQVGAFSLGVGLWLAALSARFRDLSMLTQFLIQLWMYATPVIYPLSAIPHRWLPWVALNPMAVPVEYSRAMLLGSPSPSAGLLAISLGMTLAVLVSGLALFDRAEKTFVDVA